MLSLTRTLFWRHQSFLLSCGTRTAHGLGGGNIAYYAAVPCFHCALACSGLAVTLCRAGRALASAIPFLSYNFLGKSRS